MNNTTALLPNSTADKWDQAMYAFLAEKQRRSSPGLSGLPPLVELAGKTW